MYSVPRLAHKSHYDKTLKIPMAMSVLKKDREENERCRDGQGFATLKSVGFNSNGILWIAVDSAD